MKTRKEDTGRHGDGSSVLEGGTAFEKVDRVRALKAFHTILLDSPMNHNQIYAEPEDYDFVLEYISRRIQKK